MESSVFGRVNFRRFRLRRFAIIGIAVAVAAAGFVALSSMRGPEDPVYRGKRLSAHLLGIFAFPQTPTNLRRAKPGSINEAHEEAIKALRALGRQAAPLLSNWVVTPEPALRKQIRTICEKRDWPCPRSFQDRKSLALWGARIAPEAGEGLLPLFLGWVEHGAAAERYTGIVLLDDLLPLARSEIRLPTAEAILPLVPRILNEWDAPGIRLAQTVVKSAPPDRSEKRRALIRAILQCPVHPAVGFRQLNELADQLGADASLRENSLTSSSEPGEKLACAFYFSTRGTRADQAIPVLTDGLSSTNFFEQREALEGLARYGGSALPALPLIISLAKDHSEISMLASNVAEAITLNDLPFGRKASEANMKPKTAPEAD